MLDLSPANLAATVVVVKAMYQSQGLEPIGVQLCVDRVAQDAVWLREARKYLFTTAKRRQAGIRSLTVKEVIDLQDVPEEWDELAGERPGDAERGLHP